MNKPDSQLPPAPSGTDSRPNDIATAGEFRKLTRFPVALPSGRKIIMAPMSLQFALVSLPRLQSLAGRLAQVDAAPPTEDEAAEFESWVDRLVVDVLAEPKASLRSDRSEAEVHPREIPALDRLMIFRVAVGEVSPSGDGLDLAEFRRQPAGTSPVAGPGGGDLRSIAERASEPAREGSDGVPV